MVTNRTATVVIEGISVASTLFKRDETEEKTYGHFYALKEKYENEEPVGLTGISGDVFVITGERVAYIIKPITLYENTFYDISGVVVPGNRMVYLSAGFTKGDIAALKNSVIATAYADKQGNFKFEGVFCEGNEGVVAMWMTVPPNEATISGIEYMLSVTTYDSSLGNVLTYAFSKEKGSYTKPFFTITGTCTKDIEKVFLSKTDNTLSLTELMETLCTAKDTENGTWKLEHSGEYDQSYVLWCTTIKGGSFQVNEILLTEDTTTCLSADTLITMADGSKRRLDSINIGDEVLSKDGTITKVYNVRSGHFSDSHTLYTFEDGTVVDETHPHRFYNVEQGFWQRLQLWRIGEHALKENGEEVALKSVEHISEQAEMFGIWTDSGMYFANGLLSGAAFCNKELLKEASAEQAVDMMLSADEDWLLQLMGIEGELP
jgi:hypothetical protein